MLLWFIDLSDCKYLIQDSTFVKVSFTYSATWPQYVAEITIYGVMLNTDSILIS